jgi:hypothetical protein
MGDRRYLLEDEAADYLDVPINEVRRLPGLSRSEIGPRTIRYDILDLKEYRLRMPPPVDAVAMTRFIRGRVADHAQDDGHIYFLRCREAIKLGWSRQPIVRHRRFRSIIPFEVDLLGFIEGSKAAEQEIHKRLAPLRFGHLQEWFKATPALIGAIEDLCHGQ